MLISDKIKISRYKCFNEKASGFDQILPINVIIGKNNSGKSSLIDLIEFLSIKGNDIVKTDNALIEIEHIIDDNDIKNGFLENQKTSWNKDYRNDFSYGKEVVKGHTLKYSFLKNKSKKFESINAKYYQHIHRNLNDITKYCEIPLSDKTIKRISAERDIIPEQNSADIKLASNGAKATNLIQTIINHSDKDQDLIEKELLENLNKILSPDIIFSRIFVQHHSNVNKWEINFEDQNGNKVALSKMGSGIKTIILVLLNLLVIPAIDKKKPNEYVFAFEELENNLHPSLQRRLFEYLKEFSNKNDVYFFLTTHSNVVIDSFGSDENSQIIHVTNNGVYSSSHTLLSSRDKKRVLHDLGLKASDILQSNGVIWVEGPSDRVYINKWISLIAPELKEGIHYSIMFYGGRLLANLSFDYDWFNADVIPLIKINKNAFVVMDRDGKRTSAKLNETKKRISSEIGENNYWITKGREIENYLTDDIIINWMEGKHNFKNIKFANDINEKLENIIAKSGRNIKIKYNTSKTKYSTEISSFITKASLNYLDLKTQLNNLVKQVKYWNHL